MLSPSINIVFCISATVISANRSGSECLLNTLPTSRNASFISPPRAPITIGTIVISSLLIQMQVVNILSLSLFFSCYICLLQACHITNPNLFPFFVLQYQIWSPRLLLLYQIIIIIIIINDCQ